MSINKIKHDSLNSLKIRIEKVENFILIEEEKDKKIDKIKY